MPTSLAIAVEPDFLTVVRAEFTDKDSVRLTSWQRIDRVAHVQGELSADTSEGPPPELAPLLDSILEGDVDSAFVIVRSKELFYEPLEMPFADIKKVEQVAPLQIQDSAPFEIDEFVFDTLQLMGGPAGEFHFLASLIPEEQIQSSLKSLGEVANDTRLMTTNASALAGLPAFFPDRLIGSYAILEIGARHSSLALFVDGSMAQLREFPFGEASNDTELASVFASVRCSIAGLAQSIVTPLERIFVIASPELTSVTKSQLTLPVEALDLAPFIEFRGDRGSFEPMGWALGVLSSELNKARRKPKAFLDFRKGRYAYRSLLKSVFAALREETFYIGLAIALGLAWVGLTTYSNFARLGELEEAIVSVAKSALPGKSLTASNAIAELRAKVASLEAQQLEFGSSLGQSPLEAMRELSVTFPPSLDVQIEAMALGGDGISFRGSVADNPSVGALESALEGKAGKFCSPEVKPGERTGNGRVRFSASIKLCQ